MTLTDPLGDMITRIRNGQLRGLSKISTPGSNLRRRVLDVLTGEGYIRGYSETTRDNGALEFDIELKYYEGRPVINEIKRVSTPGRRVYSSIKELRMVRNGLGISILSTPKGVMSDNVARDQNVGGEVLCEVF
ncbi:MAG TPA: 30S ribosomal protein S8 [Alphaproteobacteria bacterium]|nr:30S ribosomal protein S8 [Alphaproteobacteria bacterium]HAJ45537.1 30S ribosomal protein S8 [Alphaproteobacteria bacterium]